MHPPIPPEITNNDPEQTPGISDTYAVPHDLRDEMVDLSGELRPHWTQCVSMLNELGTAKLERCRENARRTIHENGVTHNVTGDPNGLDRPWDLDLIPLLIAPQEWSAVSEGLIQRARLLDLLLADIYGPKRAILDGLLPPELVWGNTAFLRACHSVPVPGNRRLYLYAADLVRTQQGDFQVLSDRTQAPSGAGYLLENRIAVLKSIPEIFNAYHVERLAPFFVALRDSLLSSCPRRNPRIVLLTPGPYNETYFEHSYLAQYLGYSLVQGNDLTVRDEMVYLKTVGGLQRVDVILRRVDDDFCDNLELFADSYLGVPGLLHAVRQGNVTVANSLGTGVLQAPGFLPFLPALCRAFLGEELKLPSVPTWWCGQRKELQYVLEHLPDMVIKSAYPTRGADPVFGYELPEKQLSELADAMKSHPEQYVAQSPAMSCTTPAFSEHEVQPRRFVLRSYLVSRDDSYMVMNGGLTRITPSVDSVLVSLQRGGGSKDTWVLSDAPVPPVTLLANGSQPVPHSRGTGDLPSMIADNLFWLGRYVERTEGKVLLARTALRRFVEGSGREDSQAAKIIATWCQPGGNFSDGPEFVRGLVQYVRDEEEGLGMRDAFLQIQSLTRVLRDRFPADAYRVLQEGYQNLFDRASDEDRSPEQAMRLLDGVVTGLAAFCGLATDSMMGSQAWRFYDMGRRLEGAMLTLRLLRNIILHPSDDRALLEAVLEITESAFPYRRRYLTRLERLAAVDLLLVEENNPRSVAFQLAAVAEHLNALPRGSESPDLHDNRDQQLLGAVRSLIKEEESTMRQNPAGGQHEALAQFLSDVLDHVLKLSDAIAHVYFSHVTVSLSRGANFRGPAR